MSTQDTTEGLSLRNAAEMLEEAGILQRKVVLTLLDLDFRNLAEQAAYVCKQIHIALMETVDSEFASGE